MRLSTSLWLSLAIAVPISVAVAWRSGGGPTAVREPITETGALHPFARLAPARPQDEVAAAIALTASDGTGLTLAALDARAVVVGPIAFTELRLTFDNPEDRTLEGTFRVTLPQGASISRFAMRQGEKWQEGEVVEQQRARQVYEDFLHRRQDPALLEQAAGNEFSARVFPIPARGRKELIVSYAQPITPEAPYVLPLRGLPAVGRLDAVVTGQGDDAPILGQIHLTGAAPDRDLRVEAARLPPGDGVRAGELALVRVRPAAEVGPDPVGSAVVLIDTSASRALGFEAQLELVARVAAGLGQAKLVVAAFDQGIDVVYQGAAAGFADAGVKTLRERQAFGASNLGAALAWAGERARALGARRVVLVSDGVPTVGTTEPGPLRQAALALKGAGVERLDALAVGGIRDDALLAGLCTAGLARDGVVIDASRGAEQAVRRLSLATRRLQVTIEGATWQWPETLEGVQPGDESLVFASLPAGIKPRLTVNGRTTDVTLPEVERPLLERAWVGAKIAQLVQRPAPGRTPAAVHDEIVQLSTRFRVLSPYTALLVLETEQDYARYKIDRQSLADILTIEGTRLALARRSGDAVTTPPTTFLPPKTRAPEASEGVVLNAPPPPPAAPAGAAPGALATATATAAPAAMDDRMRQKAQDAVSKSKREAPLRDSPDEKPAPPRAPPAPAEPPHRARGATRIDDADGWGGLPDREQEASVGAGGPGGLKMGVAGGGGPARLAGGKSGLGGGVPAGKASGGQGIGARAAVAAPRASGSGSVASGKIPPSRDPLARDTTLTPPAPAPPPPPFRFGPYEGELATVMAPLAQGDRATALTRAVAFHDRAPGDVLGLLALGEVFEATGETRSAARAYGSILDLFSSRADLRRMAGGRLERLGAPSAHALAADSYARAVQQRPDHPSSHRMLAYARLRAGDPAGALDAIEAGLKINYPEGRFRGVPRILREDMGLIGAAWIRADSSVRSQVERRLGAAGAALDTHPSLRFVLTWETDNNDVDFHIHDDRGGHAYYGQKTLPTGGELYADVTTGYGPECFSVSKPAAERPAYQLEAHYYSRGPMGYGMGKLEIIDHDGKGGLTFEERPFVIMQDRAFVPLGTYPATKPDEAPAPTSTLPRP